MNRKLNRKGTGRTGRKNSYKRAHASYNKSATTAMKQIFATARQFGASIGQAAGVAGVPERTIYNWRDRDPEFAKAWDIGPESLIEGIEAETFRSAMNGDRQLKMFLLKSHKPATYNQRQQQPKAATSKLMDLAQLAERVRGWL